MNTGKASADSPASRLIGGTPLAASVGASKRSTPLYGPEIDSATRLGRTTSTLMLPAETFGLLPVSDG